MSTSNEQVRLRLAPLAATLTVGGEQRYLMKDTSRCLDIIVEAGWACIGVDGYIERDGGHMEPFEWIYDGSPEGNPAPDWPTFRDTTNAQARQHLTTIEHDGAMGCSFVMIDESEWRSITGQ